MTALAAALAASLALLAPATPAPTGEWPLRPQPTVVSAFDPPFLPWGSGHRGVDLRGQPGQIVRAALPGRVSWSGRIVDRGVVVVDHGRWRTTYEPVIDPPEVGTTVSAGSPIGKLAGEGSHCAPRTCLHWGLIEGETYLNPLRLVQSVVIRLLPFEIS